jgi:hypothetical protein
VLICFRFDLVPARLLDKSLPHAFVTSYIHWYDHTAGSIVFRPRETPWKDCIDQWHLRRHGTSWRMQKGSQTLLNMKSKDAQRVSSLLKPIEYEAYIHISLQMSSQTLKVEVPRLKLDFHVRDGDDQIYSRQYRGMIIDNDQEIGTLIGLTSKLVLRRASNPTDRLVLIPEGSVNYRRTLGHHLSVSISKQSNTVVHAYQLDPTLRRVLDNGALQSKLLLCYLHALTSHWLPDALTRCTGTEAALAILKSSAVRSFSGLSLENVTLLNNIATLSPSRKYYPSHARSMQQIKWDPQLYFASQHLDFQMLVKEIFVLEKTMSLFHQNNIFEDIGSKSIAWMASIDLDLHHRATIRSSTFSIADFGAEYFSTKFDAVYKARDQQPASTHGQRAFSAAAMLLRDQPLLDQKITRLQVYQKYFKNDDVKGFNITQKLPELSYDSKWMSPPSDFIRDIWCTLHYSLAKEKFKTNDFKVMVWLANMAYAPKADMEVIRAFLAFYRIPQLASCQIPARPLYTLSRGSTFEVSDVLTAANCSARSYESSSEAELPKQGSETDNEHLERIESLFTTRKDAAVQDFVADLQRQWPCSKPAVPSSDQMNKYLDTASAMKSARESFQSWYDNRTFEQYMQHISDIVERLPAASIALPRLSQAMSYKKVQIASDDRCCNSASVFASTPPRIGGEASNEGAAALSKASQLPNLEFTSKSLISTVSDPKIQLEDFCMQLNACAKTPCEQRYVDDLRVSCASLHEREDDKDSHNILLDFVAKASLWDHLSVCEKHFEVFNGKLTQVLCTGRPLRSDAIASLIHMSPRLSPVFWLSQLNLDRYITLPGSWSDIMIEFGLAITTLHKAQRLVALLDNPVEFNEEFQHVGHTNWDPYKFPETLLLEAESGILVRKVQADIAAHMMQPPDARNTVMQLNMGEGKSTTIVPIVAAALSDKTK